MRETKKGPRPVLPCAPHRRRQWLLGKVRREPRLEPLAAHHPLRLAESSGTIRKRNSIGSSGMRYLPCGRPSGLQLASPPTPACAASASNDTCPPGTPSAPRARFKHLVLDGDQIAAVEIEARAASGLTNLSIMLLREVWPPRTGAGRRNRGAIWSGPCTVAAAAPWRWTRCISIPTGRSSPSSRHLLASASCSNADGSINRIRASACSRQ